MIYFAVNNNNFVSAQYLENEFMEWDRILTSTSSKLGLLFVSFRKYTQHSPSDWRPGGLRFNPRRGRQHSFVEIDHDIFSTVIPSLPLIQEGQLSVSGERMCTILVNRLED